jgi:aspartate aminotransferase
MLASSRSALRQAANRQFALKAGTRAASAWSSVPQGPPVSGVPN